MSQTVLIGLITAIGLLTGTIITLIGVLTKTSADFKIGKQSAGVQETTAETARIAQLVDENQKARAEVSAEWDVSQKLRQSIKLTETEHESEYEAWAAKQKSLLANIDGLLSENAELTAKLGREVAALTAERDREVAALTSQLGCANAEANTAIRGQERAEGGLQSARQTIQDMCPSH